MFCHGLVTKLFSAEASIFYISQAVIKKRVSSIKSRSGFNVTKLNFFDVSRIAGAMLTEESSKIYNWICIDRNTDFTRISG